MEEVYRNQSYYSEIVSMRYLDDDDDDAIEECFDSRGSHRRCDCSNCMDCLGLSWRDFA